MKTKIMGGLLAVLLAVGLFFQLASKEQILQITGIDLSPPKQEVVEEVLTDTTVTTSVASDTKQQNEVINVGVPVGNTKLIGVIEVGASGFNSFIVKIDKNNNWILEDKQFGESLAYEGFATTEDVKQGLKKYLSSMFTRGVSGKNIHFVISSGALKNPKTDLIAKAIASDGYVVNRVTATQEGQLALLASLPKEYYNEGFSVDMGSGNTKISWMENGKIQTYETYGAKYYQDEIPDVKAEYEISEILKKIPKDKRKYCFIIGGVPFQLAKESKHSDERFTILSNPKNYSAGKDVKLHSGLVLYKEIYNTGATPVFDWDANFTIGFLLKLNK